MNLKRFSLKRRKSPEVMILDLLERHMELCLSISTGLVKVANFKLAGNKEKMEKSMEKLYKEEIEADDIRRKIEMNLAKGILAPLSRENLTRLTQKIDLVADYNKDASRILGIIYTDDLTEGFKIVFMKFINMVEKCVITLNDAVKALFNKEFEGVLTICYEVERIEEEIDEIYIESLKVVRDSNIKMCTSLLAIEVLRFLEMVADQCEDTADLIRVVTTSSLR